MYSPLSGEGILFYKCLDIFTGKQDKDTHYDSVEKVSGKSV